MIVNGIKRHAAWFIIQTRAYKYNISQYDMEADKE